MKEAPHPIRSARRERPDASTRLYPYLLMALAALIYGNTLWFGYALDDHIVITDNRFTMKGVSGLTDIFTHDAMVGYYGADKRPVAGGRYRPLSLASHALEYEVFGASPAPSHLVNVLCYAVTVLLLYLLLQRLFPTSATTTWYRNIPFLATAFFAVHPLHTEVVANIKGRDDLLSLMFGLAALLSWLKYVEARTPGPMTLSAVWMFLSLMSKESTLAFVVIAPAISWYFGRKPVPEVVRSALPLLVAAGAYVVLRFAVLGSARSTVVPELMNQPFLYAQDGQRLATVLLTWLLYLKLLIVPHPLTHDYYPYHIQLVDFSHPLVIASIVVHAVLVYYLVSGVRRRTVVSFCVLWYLATFALYGNLVFDIGTFMNERFLYVASIAFCLWLAWVLVERVGNRTVVVALSVLVIVAGSAKTFARNFAWQDDKTLALTDVETSRGSARAQMVAGWALVTMAEDETDPKRKQQQLEEAIAHLTTSVRITDRFFPSVSLLASALTHAGRYGDALPYYEAALRLKPAEPDVMTNLQYVAEQAAEKKDFDTAIKAYRVLIAQRPTAAAYGALGTLYGKDLGDLTKAEESLVKGLRIEPRSAELTERLGIVYAMSGRTAEALEQFNRAIALDPTSASSYHNKEMALRQLGRNDEADAARRKAAELDSAR